MSGETLLEMGEDLSSEDIAALGRFGINEVIELESEDDRRRFMLACHYRGIDLSALPTGQKLTKPLTDSAGHAILDANTLITQSVKDTLKKRGMQTVFVKRSPRERQVNVAREFQIFHSRLTEARIIQRVSEEVSNLRIDDSDIIRNPKKDISVRAIEEQLIRGAADVEPRGEALRSKMILKARKTERSDSVKDSYLTTHHSIMGDVSELFSHFRDAEAVDGNFVGDMSRKIIESLIRDKDLLLNLLNVKQDVEYLAKHSFNSAVISVNIATALKYSSKQVLEVAYSALLHDVGMFRVPEKIRQKPSRLTQNEYYEIQKHPAYNLEYLQKVKNIPTSAPIVAYQVHERLDRSGYPKQKSGNLIHMFAKIVMVADVYSALTADRPYRKALSPFRASRTVVDMVSDRKFDSGAARNFLQFICLFPVGSWVRLNNDHIGKVIAANIEDYTRPVVTVMFDKNLNPIKRYTLDLREEHKLGIVDGLPSDHFTETGLMDGF
jgi:HD-GYP domain-containing protein (c-di-GMP phosphodiesterase class II)